MVVALSYDPTQSLLPREELFFLVTELSLDPTRPINDISMHVADWVTADDVELAVEKWVGLMHAHYATSHAGEEKKKRKRLSHKMTQNLPYVKYIRQNYGRRLPSITESEDDEEPAFSPTTDEEVWE